MQEKNSYYKLLDASYLDLSPVEKLKLLDKLFTETSFTKTFNIKGKPVTKFFWSMELTEAFLLLWRSYRSQLLNSSNEKIRNLAKKVHDFVLSHGLKIICKGNSGLDTFQMNLNGKVSEMGWHHLVGLDYAGEDPITAEYDHEWLHTDIGFPGWDLVATKDIYFDSYDKYEGKNVQYYIPKGTTLDAKDSPTKDSLQNLFANNPDGSLGHFGNSLLGHTMTTNCCYISQNKAGAPLYPMFINITFDNLPQFKLRLDKDGYLIVKLFNE